MVKQYRYIIAFLLLFLSLSVFADSIPDKPEHRIVDNAHLLNIQQFNDLNAKLNSIYNANKKTEIEILTINSLDGDSIADYSLQVARKWGIGQKDVNNGVLIVIAKQEHKSRIEIGYGLEGVLTDGFTGDIQRDIMSPNFKNGDFYIGLDKTVDVLSQKINGLYKNTDVKNSSSNDSDNIFIKVGMVILGVLIGLILFWSPIFSIFSKREDDNRQETKHDSPSINPTYDYIKSSNYTNSSKRKSYVSAAAAASVASSYTSSRNDDTSSFAPSPSPSPSYESSSDSVGGGGDFGGGGSSGSW